MKNKSFLLLIPIVILSLAGCSLFTGETPFDEVIDDREGILVRVASFDALAENLPDMDSRIVKTFDEIGWALVELPIGMAAESFIAELEEKKIAFMAEANMEWYLPTPPGEGWSWPEISLNAVEPEAHDMERLWGMDKIKADQAWEVTTGDANVIIAIIDTGVDMDHPEFAQSTFIAPHNATGDNWKNGTAFDIHGHGTHVTGTAAADGRYGRLAGVAWDCPIMPIRVMNNQGQILTSYLGEALIYVANYVKENSQYRAVVNMSIGGRGYSYMFKDAIDYAYEAGVLLVTSAGNDSKRVLSYPSAYNGVVSVAASTPHDKKADFSTSGFWNSVAAPGVRIWSAIPTYATGPVIPYVEMQGTSMASPHVCGAAALLLSYDPTLTPLQVKNQLEETAQAGFYGSGFHEELGYGIIDCEQLLGPLAPMKYGSLKVETDIDEPSEVPGEYDYGIILVFDETNKMTYYGSTGEEGGHNFYAMLPGTYTVTLSYNDIIHGKETVEIVAGEERTISLNLQTP